jgi:BirA family transcriptional regulator, biotin operon repressor / biotin---[acetyl-CoA-carboxylase] ligase
MLAAPEFPPLLTGAAVDASDDPFRIAENGAKAGRLGAGDLLWSPDEARVRAAIVLEPEIALEKCAAIGLVLMVAIGDALGAIGPPNLAITYRWPLTLLANGAAAGRVRQSWPQGAASSEIPEYFVVGFELNLVRSGTGEPGTDPTITWLHEEGCGDIDRTTAIEAVARHFLSWVDGFTEEGFAPAHEIWWSRAEQRDGPKQYEIVTPEGGIAGKALGLDEDGNLLIRRKSEIVALPLLEAAKQSETLHE